MDHYSHEQATHDEVNLIRLVRRLEKAVASEQEWDDTVKAQRENVWLQALGNLQKVKYGRKLLRNLVQYDSEPTPKQARQRTDLRTKLDRIELFMTEVRKRTEPLQRKPEPVLPHIPLPVEVDPQSEPNSGHPLIGEGDRTKQEPATDDTNKEPLRLREQVEGRSLEALSNPTKTSLSPPPPSSLLSPVSSLLPATPTVNTPFPISSSTALSTSSSSNTTKRKHLQTTNALHEELSNQLALMATQLKRNAQHFSDSLEKDKAVVEETQVKLEENFGMMLKERLRLRDFRVKSKGSTWMVIGIVVSVLALFVAMVGVIRFSRR